MEEIKRGSVFIAPDLQGTRTVPMKAKELEWKLATGKGQVESKTLVEGEADEKRGSVFISPDLQGTHTEPMKAKDLELKLASGKGQGESKTLVEGEADQKRGSVFISPDLQGTRSKAMKTKEENWKSQLNAPSRRKTVLSCHVSMDDNNSHDSVSDEKLASFDARPTSVEAPKLSTFKIATFFSLVFFFVFLGTLAVAWSGFVRSAEAPGGDKKLDPKKVRGSYFPGIGGGLPEL